MDNESKPTMIFWCTCPDHARQRQKMAEIMPQNGIEIISRHHGTYHVGSMSIPDLLSQLAGTIDGSAIISFVVKVIGT